MTLQRPYEINIATFDLTKSLILVKSIIDFISEHRHLWSPSSVIAVIDWFSVIALAFPWSPPPLFCDHPRYSVSAAILSVVIAVTGSKNVSTAAKSVSAAANHWAPAPTCDRRHRGCRERRHPPCLFLIILNAGDQIIAGAPVSTLPFPTSVIWDEQNTVAIV